MKKIWLIILGVMAFASDSHTDIIPRAINFVIFAAILWYLVGEKVVNFFRERRENIAKRFQEIEDKLKESKLQKETLKSELMQSKKFAEEIIENAKKEAEVIQNQIKAEVQEEINLLQKQFEEFKEFEVKKNKQEAIKEFMDEVLKDVHISSEDAAKLILKAA